MQSAAITRSSETRVLIRRAQDSIATVTRLAAKQKLSASDQEFAIRHELKQTAEELDQVRALGSKGSKRANEVDWDIQQAV